jgi:ethanolamine ammonia-lyase small subunit
MAEAPRPIDPWSRLKAITNARIGLGRAGDALPTRDLLSFQLAHAQARDAVHASLSVEAIAMQLPSAPIIVRSRAPDRSAYLRRPDLGRRLQESCRELLAPGTYDTVFVIADGLSATAVQRHASSLLTTCLPRLAGWRIAPLVVAIQARVAIGDEIGATLGAQLCVVLIGERPGLSAADSLGVYLTYAPRIGTRDAERNCISNIHGSGLDYDSAAARLVWLMTEARRRGLTGIGLKEAVDDLPAEVRPSLGAC